MAIPGESCGPSARRTRSFHGDQPQLSAPLPEPMWQQRNEMRTVHLSSFRQIATLLKRLLVLIRPSLDCNGARDAFPRAAPRGWMAGRRACQANPTAERVRLRATEPRVTVRRA